VAVSGSSRSSPQLCIPAGSRFEEPGSVANSPVRSEPRAFSGEFLQVCDRGCRGLDAAEGAGSPAVDGALIGLLVALAGFAMSSRMTFEAVGVFLLTWAQGVRRRDGHARSAQAGSQPHGSLLSSFRRFAPGDEQSIAAGCIRLRRATGPGPMYRWFCRITMLGWRLKRGQEKRSRVGGLQGAPNGTARAGTACQGGRVIAAEPVLAARTVQPSAWAAGTGSPLLPRRNSAGLPGLLRPGRDATVRLAARARSGERTEGPAERLQDAGMRSAHRVPAS